MMVARRAWVSAAALALLIAGAPVGADTVYVTDRFEIGVHDGTDLDSVILAVVPSGTPLTVLRRSDAFVEVTTPDGVKGWIDARYVVTEKPGIALVTERETRLAEVSRQLGDARAEVEVLRQRVTELQRDAATATQAAPTETRAVALESSGDTEKLGETQRALEAATRETRLLKVRVAELQASKRELENALQESGSTVEQNVSNGLWQGPVANESRSWTPWQWLLFGSILLLAFAAGGYAVDWESRRRHGGFRI